MAGHVFRARLPSAEDRARFWFWDPSHFPGPVTPAAESFDLPAMEAGFTAAARELRRPLPGQHLRVLRGFVYFGLDLPSSAPDLAVREANYERAIAPILDTALVHWQTEYEPAARRLNERLLDLAHVDSDEALAMALDEAVALRTQEWRIHDLALVPAMEAVARFTARYGERLGGVAAAQTLLQGFPNRQTEAAETLDRLAETIRKRPAIAGWLLAADEETAIPDAERASLDAALAGFLREFGRRAQGWDVGAPTWAEQPAPVLALLRERLRRPPAKPGEQRRRAAEQREAALASALASLPAEERPAFLTALRAAQAYPVISEDHNALIDQQGMAALRAVILAAGRRLAERGLLRQAEDAVWLWREELAATLRAPRDPRRLVGTRRALHARRARLTPPRTLGRPLPAWAASNPTLADFFGLRDEKKSEAQTLQGVGVAAGTVTGRACLVRGLDEVERLEPGDILVCRMTSPAWTPWLGLIAGAVVETGGMLSHTAILAREYGIPCVVNARDALERIPDGAQIAVDGAAGTVRLLG